MHPAFATSLDASLAALAPTAPAMLVPATSGDVCNGAAGPTGPPGPQGPPGAKGKSGCASTGGDASILALIGLLALVARRRRVVA